MPSAALIWMNNAQWTVENSILRMGELDRLFVANHTSCIAFNHKNNRPYISKVGAEQKGDGLQRARLTHFPIAHHNIITESM